MSTMLTLSIVGGLGVAGAGVAGAGLDWGAGCCWAPAAPASIKVAAAAKTIVLRMDIPSIGLANGLAVTPPTSTARWERPNGNAKCRRAGHCVTIGWRQCAPHAQTTSPSGAIADGQINPCRLCADVWSDGRRQGAACRHRAVHRGRE